MKTLVIFYSKTGNTRKIGIDIANQLKCDFEEIIDLKNRKGIFGFIFGGRDAMRKKLTNIKEISKKIDSYDLIIIGTPNWGSSICPATRTFLENNKATIKKAAFFCTMGGNSPGKTFIQMEEIIGKPISTVAIQAKELKGNDYINKVNEFVNGVKNL